MTVETISQASATKPANQKLAIADCDIHPSPKSVEKEIFPTSQSAGKTITKPMGCCYDSHIKRGQPIQKGSLMRRAVMRMDQTVRNLVQT